MTGGCNLNPGDFLPETDDVFQRVIRFDLNSDVKDQISNYKKGLITLDDIEVQPGLFKPRKKKDDDLFERGKSVNWSDCITAEETVKIHNNPQRKNDDFGVIEMRVKSINDIVFNSANLYCEYDPIEDNPAHALLIGFPTEMDAKTSLQMENDDLRQRMSLISKWVVVPEIVN